MKRRLFVVLLLALAGALGASPARVQVREAPLYAQPSAVAKFLGRAPLGTQLNVLETKGGWARVEAPGLPTGWMRTQAFTVQALNLKSSANTGSGVSAAEVSLAGRGFTDEVEAAYQKKNPQLDFTVLDRMEALDLPDGDLRAFLREGGLKPQGGAW